jgi:hypothetical protein
MAASASSVAFPSIMAVAAGQNSAAVCFPGWLGVNVPDAGESIRRQLVVPLGADVLLALTYAASDKCRDEASCRVNDRLRQLQPFSAVSLTPMLSIPQLVERMEGLPHWRRILKVYRSRLSKTRCFRRTGWSVNNITSSPYECTGTYGGNTIFAPVLGASHLSVLRELHDVARCLELVSSHEKQRGAQYERIIQSRIDLVWLAPHPPLHMLGRDAIWIPSEEDYGGLNDRHAVFSREAAEVCMRRWDYIVDGRVLQIDWQLGQGVVRDPYWQNSEHYLESVAHWANLRVRRFPAVAAVACCPGEQPAHSIPEEEPDVAEEPPPSDGTTPVPRCFVDRCEDRELPTRETMFDLCRNASIRTPSAPSISNPDGGADGTARAAPDVAAPLAPPAEPPDDYSPAESLAEHVLSGHQSVTVHGKYPVELEIALQHAMALSIPGSGLAVGKFVKPAGNAWNDHHRVCTLNATLAAGEKRECVAVTAPAVYRHIYLKMHRQLEQWATAGHMSDFVVWL